MLTQLAYKNAKEYVFKFKGTVNTKIKEKSKMQRLVNEAIKKRIELDRKRI